MANCIIYNPLKTPLKEFISKYKHPVILADLDNYYIIKSYLSAVEYYMWRKSILKTLQYEKLFMLTSHPDKYLRILPPNTTILVPQIDDIIIPELPTFNEQCDKCKWCTILYTCDCEPDTYLCNYCRHECNKNSKPSIHGHSSDKVLYITTDGYNYEFLYNDIPFYDIVIIYEKVNKIYYQKIKYCLPDAKLFILRTRFHLETSIF